MPTDSAYDWIERAAELLREEEWGAPYVVGDTECSGAYDEASMCISCSRLEPGSNMPDWYSSSGIMDEGHAPGCTLAALLRDIPQRPDHLALHAERLRELEDMAERNHVTALIHSKKVIPKLPEPVESSAHMELMHGDHGDPMACETKEETDG